MYSIPNGLAHRRRQNLEELANSRMESLFIKVIVQKQKWLCIEMYKPPNMHAVIFTTSIDNIFSNINDTVQCTYILGDLNVNMINDTRALSHVLDVYATPNVIQEPTCFKNTRWMDECCLTTHRHNLGKTVELHGELVVTYLSLGNSDIYLGY